MVQLNGLHMHNLLKTFLALNTLRGKFDMNVKGMCRLFFHVSLLVMCSCGFGATQRTHEINRRRGNDALKPTNITCLYDYPVMTCTWLLGKYDNNSAIDTSCNYIRSDESVQMYFLYNSSGNNDYDSWKPCPNQRPTSCAWNYTHDSDELDVMVRVKNNKLGMCTGITTEKTKIIMRKYMDHEFADETREDKENLRLTVRLAILAAVVVVCGCLVFIIRILYRTILRTFDETNKSSEMLSSNSSVSRNTRRQHKYLFPRSGYKGEYSWKECIYQKCVALASELLQDNVLPTDSELQTICGIFGKRSETLRNVCAKICETVQGKCKNFTKVWPAYTLSSDKIVFVVESNTVMALSDIRASGFRIHLIESHITLEKESQIVMLKEKERLAQCYDYYGVEKFEMLKQIISKNAEKLMDKHKCINAITPSVAKSIGYLTSGEHKLIETPCISIYVDKKVRNIIPLEEEPIPSLIDNFPTDVLEGKFDFFCNGPNDYHKVIKIGCGIHAGVRTDNGDVLGGTLGGFVKHKTFGLSCITGAHVVLSREELQSTKKYSYVEFQERETKMVFQPACEQSDNFGRLVAASYKEGGDRSPGVEVALIQVQSRKPTSGSFPSTGNGIDEPFVFDSGNVIDAKLLRPMTEVYKFGMATGPTTGYLGLQGFAVRVGPNHVDDSTSGVRLYNQLEILPKHNSSFADIGDSGALVLIGHPDCAAAIGILVGGLPNGKILVTPIIDVLEALKCPRYLYRFEQDSDSAINLQFPESAEGGNVQEDMDFS